MCLFQKNTYNILPKADIDTAIPGPSFINGTTNVIEKDDECVLNHMDPLPHPRFLGCRRRHFLVHSLIYESIGRHIEQFGRNITKSSRESSFNDVLQHGFNSKVEKNGAGERKKIFTLPERDNIPLQSVTLIKTGVNLKHPFLKDIATTNSTRLDLQIRPSPVEKCVDFSERNLSDQDIESLLQLVGGHDIAGNAEDLCHGNGNLTLLHDTYKPQSIREERKIPKIVHMTSKTRCMTDKFEENINLWRFDDHSLFIHDDDAVNRLLDKAFVEFPLLQDVRHCIHSGAGLADLWYVSKEREQTSYQMTERDDTVTQNLHCIPKKSLPYFVHRRYVVLWVYGGLYTDIDVSGKET